MMLIRAFALSLAIASSAQAASAPLTLSNAWSRPAVAGTNAVGYLTIINAGKADAIVGVASPLAARVEMHSSSMAGGVMSMKKEDRVQAPAGGKVAFAPGSYHLMLVGLHRTTKVGDTIPATLTFASGAKLKIAFTVGMGPPVQAMDHMSH